MRYYLIAGAGFLAAGIGIGILFSTQGVNGEGTPVTESNTIETKYIPANDFDKEVKRHRGDDLPPQDEEERESTPEAEVRAVTTRTPTFAYTFLMPRHCTYFAQDIYECEADETEYTLFLNHNGEISGVTQTKEYNVGSYDLVIQNADNKNILFTILDARVEINVLVETDDYQSVEEDVMGVIATFSPSY